MSLARESVQESLSELYEEEQKILLALWIAFGFPSQELEEETCSKCEGNVTKNVKGKHVVFKCQKCGYEWRREVKFIEKESIEVSSTDVQRKLFEIPEIFEQYGDFDQFKKDWSVWRIGRYLKRLGFERKRTGRKRSYVVWKCELCDLSLRYGLRLDEYGIVFYLPNKCHLMSQCHLRKSKQQTKMKKEDQSSLKAFLGRKERKESIEVTEKKDEDLTSITKTSKNELKHKKNSIFGAKHENSIKSNENLERSSKISEIGESDVMTLSDVSIGGQSKNNITNIKDEVMRILCVLQEMGGEAGINFLAQRMRMQEGELRRLILDFPSFFVVKSSFVYTKARWESLKQNGGGEYVA